MFLIISSEGALDYIQDCGSSRGPGLVVLSAPQHVWDRLCLRDNCACTLTWRNRVHDVD